MPIPERLRLSPMTRELISEMSELCDQIEHTLESGDDANDLLAEWHRHAGRTCEPHEFMNYWRSIDKEEFVRDALNPKPRFMDDLTYPEVFAVLQSLVKAELKESGSYYYLRWLEAQFPNSNMSDLIYWPDEWFGDASLFRDAGGAFKPEAELSLDQILAYAMEKSGRSLSDRPNDITLPFPIPE